jgi:hypothetical protein
MGARRVALKARVISAWAEAPGLPVETACGLKKVLNNRSFVKGTASAVP